MPKYGGPVMLRKGAPPSERRRAVGRVSSERKA